MNRDKNWFMRLEKEDSRKRKEAILGSSGLASSVQCHVYTEGCGMQRW